MGTTVKYRNIRNSSEKYNLAAHGRRKGRRFGWSESEASGLFIEVLKDWRRFMGLDHDSVDKV